MSLKSLLPQPKNTKKKNPLEAYNEITSEETPQPSPQNQIPPYGERKNFIPRTDEDFGDGGAYPEIHLLQYPKGIGKKHNKTQKQLTLQVDQQGKLNYDDIIKQRHGNKVLYTKYNDMVEKVETEPLVVDEEKVQESVERTKKELEKLTETRIKSSAPGNKVEDTFLRIQTQDDTKIVKVIELPVDPLEPPKFKLKKGPPRPPSPPVTILHSPPRKLTKDDMENWKIPPCISNWKNPKGFTIALDKRLAADGRGLQEVQVNNSFAKLSESLYAAEKISREDLEKRKELQKLVQLKEKEEREENLKKLVELSRKQKEEQGDSSDEEKERIRNERRREIKDEKRHNKRRGKEDDRDITEKIALGQPQNKSSEDQIDARLYNYDSGLTSGSFKTFDKPLFQGGSSNIYKFKGNEVKDFDMDRIKEDKFTKPTRELSGGQERSEVTRDGPVQFEREDDPFGMNKFLNEAKEGAKKRGLEDIGKGGTMKLSSGGSYDSLKGSKRSKIEFEKEI